MTIHHVDTSLTVDGSGSLANPYNTIASVVTGAGDTVLIKTGTLVPAVSIPIGLQSKNTVTIGAYGSGDKPEISGGTVRADWTQDAGNGVWYRDYASNIVGNIVQDGAPLKFVAWTTNIATTAVLMVAGSFSFDYNTFRLYIKPSSGVPSDHEYIVSERNYCLTNSAAVSGAVVRDLKLTHASRHALLFFNKTDFLLDGNEIQFVGGFRDTAHHLGNGFELSAGCLRGRIQNNEWSDIFDSGSTSQLYEGVAARIHSHEYYSNIARRCGLAGIEISCQTANQSIENIMVDGLVVDGLGRGWSDGGTGGAGSGGIGVSLLTQDVSSRVKGCDVRNIRGSGMRRAVVCSRTGSLNRIADIQVSDHIEAIATSSNVNGDVIQWANVVGDGGVTPSGGGFAHTPGVSVVGSVLSM
jgi:hypothetical protein